jgi:hypothetical protein
MGLSTPLKMTIKMKNAAGKIPATEVVLKLIFRAVFHLSH